MTNTRVVVLGLLAVGLAGSRLRRVTGTPRGP